MKRQVRQGVFETNSSSTHSLTVCTKEEFEKWEKGELLFDRYDDEFVSPEKSSVLTDEDKEFVKERYDRRKQKYWKNWEELSDQEKEEMYLERMKEKRRSCRYQTCDEYFDSEYLDTFEESYTTPKGEEIVIFGKYGYDG